MEWLSDEIRALMYPDSDDPNKQNFGAFFWMIPYIIVSAFELPLKAIVSIFKK